MTHKKLIIFMPSIEMGGVEKNLFIISNYLSLKFKETTLITSSSNTKKFGKKVKIVSFDLLNNIFKFRSLKILISCILLIKEIIKNKFQDVTILSFQANIYSILIAKIFKKKIIVRLNSSPTGWLKNSFKRKIFTKIYSLSNLIIVNSREFKNEIKKKLYLKSICIYNPLDKEKIVKKAKINFKKNPYKIKNSLKLISVGRLVDQKDHLTLLRSINNIKNKIKVELILIGQGKNEILLNNYIKINRLEKNIKILGYKKNPYPFIKYSNVLVLTSKYEGLPNVLLEAIALKRFVISSDCPTGPKEILDNGKGGMLFRTGNYKDLSKKIILYKNQTKVIKRKINHAYSLLKKYDSEKNLNLYYKNLIKLN